VTWYAETSKWRADVRYKGARKFVGYFEGEEEAARERDLELLRMVQEANVRGCEREHVGLLVWCDATFIPPSPAPSTLSQGKRPPVNRFNFPPEELLKSGLPPRRETKPKSSRYMGVTWIEAKGKWQAFISLPVSAGGQELNRSLRVFDNEEQAARARDRAILRLVEQACCGG
jgi:hypothetical protein